MVGKIYSTTYIGQTFMKNKIKNLKTDKRQLFKIPWEYNETSYTF